MTGSPVVIDASFAMKLLLVNAMRPQCRAAMAYLVQAGYELQAPTLWAYETTSVVCKAIHFNHLTENEGWRTLDQLAQLDVKLIAPDVIENRHALAWSLRLKRAATYDSYYLALAETFKCELWTADRRLINAVSEPWVRWIGTDIS